MNDLTVLQPKRIMATAKGLGWRRDGEWLVYDLYSYAARKLDRCRKRRIDTTVKPRFLFGNGNDPTPSMYMLPGLKTAVIAEGNELWITAGETDMLSMIAVGFRNVAALLGETRDKTELAKELKAYKIERVFYVADNDDTGIPAAYEVMTAFQAQGLQVLVKRVPKAYKDVNEFYVDQLSRDMGAIDIYEQINQFEFWTADKLKAAGAIAKDKPASTASPTPAPTTNDGTPPDGLWRDIENKLIPSGAKYKSGGWSQLTQCPFRNHEHDKDNPAFALHSGYSFKCQKCGETGGWVKLSKQLGLHIKDYAPVPAQLPQANLNKPAQPAKSSVYGWLQMASEVKARVSESMANPRAVRGLPFGFEKFDATMQGLIEKDLFIIYTRPHMGKSTFAMQAVLNFALHEPGVIISPEMSPTQWLERMLDNLYGWKQLEITTGRVGRDAEQRILADVDKIFAGRKEIKYPDVSRITQEELLTFAKDYAAQGYKWMLVDSLQNIKSPKRDTYTNTAETMYTLQEIANTHMRVMATAQANRGSNASRPPSMDEIEGGGVIEQLARRIVMLNRPAYAWETGRVDYDATIDARLVQSRCYKDRFYPNGGRPFEFLLDRQERYGFKEVTSHQTIDINTYKAPLLATAQDW